jgi:biotin carboxyl carrier protein
MKLRITIEGKAYEVDVEVLDEGTPATPAPVVPAKPAPSPHLPGERVCKAPIPGNIVRINVSPGQSVEAGEVVLLLEAMKMQTPIKSPVSGTVKSVRVKEGQAVTQGQLLVELE